jgi:vancomycin permeability regulator SanA
MSTLTLKQIISATFAVIIVYLCAYIILFGLYDVTPKSDLIVVPGNTVNPDGSLSLRLRARMDRAIKLFKDEKGTYLLVSGATGEEGVEESSAMKAYAESEGVPGERIIVDSHGINTDATAKNTAQFLSASKLHSVIIVSQFFHLARMDLSFSQHGVTQLGHAHADYFEWRDIYSLLREVVALPVYWATK